MPIKIILIVGFVLLSVLCIAVVRSRLATRLFFVAQFLLGVAFVLFPSVTTAIAHRVGVGRGTDLILYLLVMMVYAGGILILAKFRRMEQQLTVLTRQIALQDAEKKSP